MKKSVILILLLATCFLQCTKEDGEQPVIAKYYSFYNENNKWGYIDKDGKVVIEPLWDKAYDFWLGYGQVAQDSKWGLINQKGEVVVPLQYEKMGIAGADVSSILNSERYIIAAKLDGKWGYIDKNNNIISSFKFSYAGTMVNGLAPVKDFNMKWGYVDDMGEVVIPLIYDGFGFFYEDKCWVGKIINGVMKWGVINRQGVEIIPFNYILSNLTTDYNPSRFSNGISNYRLSNSEAGFIDASGNKLFGKTWEGAGFFSEGLAAVRKNNLVGYINTLGNEVIPYQFASGGTFTGGIAGFRQTEGGLWGYINKSGQVVVSPQFTSGTTSVGELYWVVYPDGTGAYINNTGKVVWHGTTTFIP